MPPMPTLPLATETIEPDEPAITAAFIAFLTRASQARHPAGVMPRFNQGRAAACVSAELTVPDDLAPDLRVGLFAHPGMYAARIRFANASTPSDREKDVRGMSIKVQVPGIDTLTGESAHDLILNSHPVMMVGRTRTFLELLQAVEAGRARQALFFLSHPRAAATALASRGHATSHLEIPYWSTTPYLFGPGRAVKYIVRPASARVTPLPSPLTDTYLRDRLAAHLAVEDARFDLLVQFQTDSRTMPIEDASVEWRPADSPYRRVAHIRLPVQPVDLSDRDGACERLSFNPWNAPAEHRPLGDFNRSRREIYRAMAALRHTRQP